jgi:UDP-GlcNAc3NAcA epimerase
MLVAVKHAGLVITDSGGLQKEAAFVDTPCVTLRDETEWTETVDIGVNVLSGTGSSEIEASVSAALEVAFDDNVARALDQHFGSGTAAKTIVEDLVDHF